MGLGGDVAWYDDFVAEVAIRFLVEADLGRALCGGYLLLMVLRVTLLLRLVARGIVELGRLLLVNTRLLSDWGGLFRH